MIHLFIFGCAGSVVSRLFVTPWTVALKRSLVGVTKSRTQLRDIFTLSPSFQISHLLVDDPEFYLAVY